MVILAKTSIEDMLMKKLFLVLCLCVVASSVADPGETTRDTRWLSRRTVLVVGAGVAAGALYVLRAWRADQDKLPEWSSNPVTK